VTAALCVKGAIVTHGKADTVDILHLIDHLNGVFQPPMKVWQCDIDRSGVCGPADLSEDRRRDSNAVGDE
jgi:hypothetical protein